MTDGQIVAAIIVEVRRQLELYGIASGDLRIARSSQPTSQYSGADPDSTKYQVYIEPITNTQVGLRRRYADNGDMTVKHTKQKTYQISTLADFDPSVSTDIPAHDLAQIVNDTIKHPDALRELTAKGVYLLDSGPVRPSFQVNDSDEYESMPNFDIVVSYNAEYTKPVPDITHVTGSVDRV